METTEINLLTTMLSTYTNLVNQQYHETSKYGVSIISLVYVLVAAVATVFGVVEKKDTESVRNIYIGLSILLLMVPALITLFLNVFAYNMKKEAILRGYCKRIERQISELTTEKFYYTELAVDEFNNHVCLNKVGGGCMITILAIPAIFCFIVGPMFAAKGFTGEGLNWYIFCEGIIAVLCLLICGAAVHDLMTNGDTIKRLSGERDRREKG